MASPVLSVTSASIEDIAADALVIGVSAGDDSPELQSSLPQLESLRSRLQHLGVTGTKDEIVRVHVEGIRPKVVALVGLGKDEIGPESLRAAAGSAARQLLGIETLAFALPTENETALRAVLEGAAIGAYTFTSSRGKSRASTKVPATALVVHSTIASTEHLVHEASAIAEAMEIVRDLVNTPPSDLYPASFADRAKEVFANMPSTTVEVLAEEQLRTGGFGGILGVGGGSTRGPRLVKIDYAPEEGTKHLALVGKGITFDSGGLSLKPAASMVGMKYDMAGAASVLGVILAAARLALPVHLTAWLCLAENMPSGDALRPNDVITVRGGTTIEVLNTDAEGRLVLADGLVAAGEEGPDAIVDVATLTGAAIVALGTRYAAVMGDTDFVAKVCAAAEVTGEKIWPMPFAEELRSALNSDIADLANARIGNPAGGMLLAASFLKEFTTRRDDGTTIPWAHLDIAGPANNAGAGYGFTGKGATGVTVRTLLELAREFSTP